MPLLIPLFTDAFLRARWGEEFARFQGSPEERALVERLRNWSARIIQRESTAEAAFIDVFFKE